MKQLPLGNTGMNTSVLGFGAGKIGDPHTSESEVSLLLNTALDLGITLIDTARSYGLSEERIGKHLRNRRDEFLLSTKVGYGIPGIPDWTAPCITAGVENALRLLQTDCIDMVHLHSCPLEVLQKGEVTEALLQAVHAGKVRVAAYSGDKAPARWAVESGKFQCVQMSLNICDQDNIEVAAIAGKRGVGVIGKRPLANAVWRYAEKPSGDDAAAEYWERWQKMAIDSADLDPTELAMRFALSIPDIHVCLAGTRSIENLKRNIRYAENGPLPNEMVAAIRNTFRLHGSAWPAMT